MFSLVFEDDLVIFVIDIDEILLVEIAHIRMPAGDLKIIVGIFRGGGRLLLAVKIPVLPACDIVVEHLKEARGVSSSQSRRLGQTAHDALRLGIGVVNGAGGVVEHIRRNLRHLPDAVRGRSLFAAVCHEVGVVHFVVDLPI